MNDEIDYRNNPLHGVSLKSLLTELTDQYGFQILYAYLNINCFKNNPSIQSSVKFLKKTDWAREKVESFYLYEFKNLPRASSEQFQLSPRDRVIPEGQAPGEPAELSLADAKRLRDKREQRSSGHGQKQRVDKGPGAQRSPYSNGRDNKRASKSDNKSSDSAGTSADGNIDPWAKAKSRSKR